ncbi:hypothetical protein WDU94_007149 [Cyamophila willieti]
MYRFVLVYFVFTIGIKQIEGGGNEITTVYKFKTIQSDTEDVKYLNICSVLVHVEDNQLQLPLFNINGDSSLPESTIPPLYSEHDGTSRWQLMMENGTTQALPAIRNKTDSSKIFDMDLASDDQTMTLCDTDIVEKSVSSDGDLFQNLKKHNGRYILEVRFEDSTPIRVFILWNCSYSGYTGTRITIEGGRDIRICNVNSILERSNCALAPQKYVTDKNGRGHIDIDITKNIIITDKVSSVTYETQIPAIQGCTTFSIKHVYDYSSSTGNKVSYKLKHEEKKINLVSPWLDIKHNQTFFILHARERGSNLSVYLENVNIGNLIQLPCEELTQVNKTDSREVVLTKVTVSFPQNWEGQKRIQIIGGVKYSYISIGNVWEGKSLDLYRTQEPQTCMKSNIRDIYNIPILEHRTRAQGEILSHCFNGGRLENSNSICICPPGFVGNACEIPCGNNLFGSSCMKQCSKSPKKCKGIVLCTPEYGCTCAPGYEGDYCLEQCQPGFYGADCKQQCGNCRDECDIYTGACHDGCNTSYLIRPQCKHSHSYLLSSGQVSNSSFNQISLQIDFSRNNLVNSNDNIMFYMMQYRENMNSTWINGTYELFNEVLVNVTVQGLKPGRIYQFRTLLIDEALETHDPILTRTAEGRTKCTVFYKGTLQTSNITNTSVSISWNDENDLEPTECPAEGYILEIHEMENIQVDKERILINGKNSYTVENLSPGRTYQINLKKSTVHGESVPIYGTKVTTIDILDFSEHIIGVSLLKNKTSVNIKWFSSPTYKTFYIKYKLKRHLACKNEGIIFPMQVKTTSQTSYSLKLNDLEGNSQYELFVTADINQNINPNNNSFITFSRVPSTIPTILQEKLKINNESAMLYWTDFSLSCQHMNGNFKAFKIELYNKQNLSEHVFITPDNHITITGLIPETKYDVKIRFLNHVGSSPVYQEHSFQTKQTSVFFIQDLTAYKAGVDFIGLRWKCVVTNQTINSGINIYLQTVIWNKTITVSENLSTFQCKAWPGFMCFEVTELMSNTKYTIRMDTIPEGSEIKTIQAVTKENAPSPVSDIKADCTNTSMTVSWRIPNLLNGILRNFVLEWEQLSSYDETMCCQNLLIVNYTVSMEQETYSYTLQNIKLASSYQVSIRPFTKRAGSITSQIIDTPPLPIPLRMKPQIKLNNFNIQFKEDQKTSTTENNDMISETLVIVQEFNEDANVKRHESDRFLTDMSRILASNTWWITHICAANDDKCSVDLNVDEYQNSTVPYYGQVVRKRLERNSRYRIVVAQVNKYLSARSYTVVPSEYFTMD